MKTYTIQANEKSSRFIEVNEEHLMTIKKYDLLNGLIESNGIVDQKTLEKLQMNVRALLDTTGAVPELLGLCQGVLFHDNMKAFGLGKLIELFASWKKTVQQEEETTA